ADLIIISCHGQADLAIEVRAWIELWLAENVGAIALVALFDSPDADPEQTDSIRDYLVGVARRGQMEFFAQPHNWPIRKKQAPQFPLRISSPLDEEAIATFSSMMQQDLSFPRWGINE